MMTTTWQQRWTTQTDSRCDKERPNMNVLSVKRKLQRSKQKGKTPPHTFVAHHFSFEQVGWSEHRFYKHCIHNDYVRVFCMCFLVVFLCFIFALIPLKTHASLDSPVNFNSIHVKKNIHVLFLFRYLSVFLAAFLPNIFLFHITAMAHKA